MKQVTFYLGEISILLNIETDLNFIYKNGIIIWVGTHFELISLLESI